MKRTATVLFALVLLVAGSAFAADGTRWLNVHVTELDEGTNVEVHLPLNLVLTVIKSVDVENFHSGKVDLEIEDADIDWPEIMRALKDAPDGEFVKVDADDANVLVSKSGGIITVNVTEMGDESEDAVVKVTLPDTMFEALTIDENNQIDVATLLQSFEDLPDGDLVTVDARDAKVRVWIE
jgi:hypothetical protein